MDFFGSSLSPIFLHTLSLATSFIPHSHGLVYLHFFDVYSTVYILSPEFFSELYSYR